MASSPFSFRRSASKGGSPIVGESAPLHPLSKAPSKAVLIGINYTAWPVYKLKGCHADVADAEQYLLKIGAKGEHIKILTDKKNLLAPTKAAILEAFDWLKEGAQDGDVLYIHFSGHGIETPPPEHNPLGRASSKAICPIDVFHADTSKISGKWEYDKMPLVNTLTGEDLHKIFGHFEHTKVNLTVVYDCCHSTGALRAVNAPGEPTKTAVRGINIPASVSLHTIVNEKVEHLTEAEEKTKEANKDDKKEEKKGEKKEEHKEEHKEGHKEEHKEEHKDHKDEHKDHKDEHKDHKDEHKDHKEEHKEKKALEPGEYEKRYAPVELAPAYCMGFAAAQGWEYAIDAKTASGPCGAFSHFFYALLSTDGRNVNGHSIIESVTDALRKNGYTQSPTFTTTKTGAPFLADLSKDSSAFYDKLSVPRYIHATVLADEKEMIARDKRYSALLKSVSHYAKKQQENTSHALLKIASTASVTKSPSTLSLEEPSPVMEKKKSIGAKIGEALTPSSKRRNKNKEKAGETTPSVSLSPPATPVGSSEPLLIVVPEITLTPPMTPKSPDRIPDLNLDGNASSSAEPRKGTRKIQDDTSDDDDEWRKELLRSDYFTSLVTPKAGPRDVGMADGSSVPASPAGADVAKMDAANLAKQAVNAANDLANKKELAEKQRIENERLESEKKRREAAEMVPLTDRDYSNHMQQLITVNMRIATNPELQKLRQQEGGIFDSVLKHAIPFALHAANSTVGMLNSNSDTRDFGKEIRLEQHLPTAINFAQQVLCLPEVQGNRGIFESVFTTCMPVVLDTAQQLFGARRGLESGNALQRDMFSLMVDEIPSTVLNVLTEAAAAPEKKATTAQIVAPVQNAPPQKNAAPEQAAPVADPAPGTPATPAHDRSVAAVTPATPAVAPASPAVTPATPVVAPHVVSPATPTPPVPASPAPTTHSPASPAPTSPAPTTPAPTSPAPASPAPAHPAAAHTPAPATPAPATPAPATPAPATPTPATPAATPAQDRAVAATLAPVAPSSPAPAKTPASIPDPAQTMAEDEYEEYDEDSDYISPTDAVIASASSVPCGTAPGHNSGKAQKSPAKGKSHTVPPSVPVGNAPTEKLDRGFLDILKKVSPIILNVASSAVSSLAGQRSLGNIPQETDRGFFDSLKNAVITVLSNPSVKKLGNAAVNMGVEALTNTLDYYADGKRGVEDPTEYAEIHVRGLFGTILQNITPIAIDAVSDAVSKTAAIHRNIGAVTKQRNTFDIVSTALPAVVMLAQHSFVQQKPCATPEEEAKYLQTVLNGAISRVVSAARDERSNPEADRAIPDSIKDVFEMYSNGGIVK